MSRTIEALRALTAVAVAGAGMVGALPASSADIWRCGNSYSDRPCGSGSIVDAGDARSEEQRRHALQGTKNNAAAAQELERARRRVEAAQTTAVLIVEPSAKAIRPAGKPKKSKSAEPERYIATDPASVARRASKTSKK